MISNNVTTCPKCGGALKYYDSVSRIVKTAGGIKHIIKLKRFRCHVCYKIYRELPKTILPYKHYEASIIFGVLIGEITPYDLEYEDYPCEATMMRWLAARKLHSLY